MADEKLVKILTQGAAAWIEWREENSGIIIDLNGADLSRTNLSGTDLNCAELKEAKLSEADISEADLSGADLRGADLRGTYLSGSDLRGADFTNANLSGADLRGADLGEIRNSRVNFTNAVLENTLIEFSEFEKTVHDCADTEETVFIYDENMFRENRTRIIKSIEFSPEQKQAGMSILTYFGNVVQQKYPDLDVKVVIEQDENKVRMIVETPEGEEETIEEALEEYGMVVSGQMNPEELLYTHVEAVQLKQKLELSEIELRHAKELLELTKNNYENRIGFLEGEISRLHNIICVGLSNSKDTNDLFKAFIEKYNNNEVASAALKLIEEKLNTGIDNEVAERIFSLLSEAKKQNPGIVGDLKQFILNTLSGAGGNLMSSYGQQLPALLSIIHKLLGS